MNNIDTTEKLAEEFDDFIFVNSKTFSKLSERINLISYIREKGPVTKGDIFADLFYIDREQVQEDLDVLRRHGVLEFEDNGYSLEYKHIFSRL